ncbi:NAD(P)-dependent oxidoreductase [Labrys miyagiensis]|uniref:NAD(P)-dependent oxidoreductase n=1 Tax=Labrys miyagiensis TaxID=346912 RepID=A0ABQ6CI53_9HYPH|nr:SDR family oxidoreductase [Labrys miyagiensis]GLS18389.1 NAD(P)-dependent oxidoreductase [Labrys miyagiensis]
MNLLIFGLGYTASHFAARYGRRFAHVAGTYRSPTPGERLPDLPDVERLEFDGLKASSAIEAVVASATHILTSIAPDDEGDPVLRHFGGAIAQAPHLAWIGYLSTVGVYGDADGAWIDETAPLRPTLERNGVRVRVEQAWLDLARRRGADAQIFRLAGIYGPGRNAIVNLRRGTARRVVKPGQVFNRIHVEDIAGTVMAGIDHPKAGPFFNVTDNEPAPPQDVVTFAARRLGVEPPPEIAYEAAQMSPMARSFYGENKRVSNRRIREDLGYRLRYPTYREGIHACFQADA